MNAGYTIKLPQFEGPFDLLLFFIERDELDIHDIPIAKITNDFLGYIQQMEALNIDLEAIRAEEAKEASEASEGTEDASTETATDESAANESASEQSEKKSVISLEPEEEK